MTRQVVVVDYGIGNLHSVKKALEHEGASVLVSSSPADLAAADRVVLPGVGAFADGMRELEARRLVEPLRDFFRRDRPFLGICLGMQLLLTTSEEFGSHVGLGVIPGRVVKIAPASGYKIPHVAWAPIVPASDWTGTLLSGSPPGTMTYFVHSYTAVPDADADRLADIVYGGFRVSAAVRRGAVVGCQFHPEKSGPAGLAMMNRFLSI